RPSRQPDPASADGRVPGRGDRARVRPGVGDRSLRHHTVLGPHGPARAADAGGRPAARAGGPDHAGAAPELIRNTPSLAAPGAAFEDRQVHGPPRDGVADVRDDDVGGPLLAVVQRVARGSADPWPRASAVPERGAPLLVARGGARPGALADEPPGAD